MATHEFQIFLFRVNRYAMTFASAEDVLVLELSADAVGLLRRLDLLGSPLRDDAPGVKTLPGEQT